MDVLYFLVDLTTSYDMIKLLWLRFFGISISIYTGYTIKARRPDTFIIDKVMHAVSLIDISIPADPRAVCRRMKGLISIRKSLN